ncbi:amidase [Horticoccus sp. 23ND18S-11]|uniref:amidase n=1 Tax=Horticoccus sp. 23ND18S-11 TaxID=3391832 RepID=UPI0039C8F222
MNTTRRSFLKLATPALTLSAIGGGPTLAGAEARGPAADPLCFTSARELARVITQRTLSAREVMAAHLRQIERVNPRLTAIVAKLDDGACMALAAAADERQARGETIGALHGLPIAIKDTEPAVGFPFTRGSVIFRHDQPTADSVNVERLRRAGALFIGKTNVPEFAMGSHTYNRVYGTTYNPYDLTRSAGGSSGGAAAALAAGLMPIANGSDLGGSLRNPGNFNNVVGFRPTVGVIPAAPVAMPFGNLAVKGPLARSVADIAFLMSVMAGADARDPACYPSDPAVFNRPLERDLKGVRVAWCPDLGALPLDPAVRTVLASQRAVFERLGCIVDDAYPDFGGVDDAFLTLRAWRTWSTWGPLLAAHRHEMKPEAVGEIEAGAAVTVAELTRAMTVQAQFMERMRVFQEKYEFIVCAVNQVPPFAASLDWPKAIDGTAMETYVAWMKSAYWISASAHPAISVPAGFTTDGLPVGIQIVGRYRADFELLQCAHVFEQATQVGKRRPAIAG